MKLLKLLKRLAFGLLGAVMAVLVTATVLEKIYGTDFAAAHIYGAGWFAALWGALTLAALACLFRRKLWRKRGKPFRVSMKLILRQLSMLYFAVNRILRTMILSVKYSAQRKPLI